ncbi:translation initiation factor IF-2 [Sporolactobacillus terrae]|uniref:Translation initiation factor IF-2 n=1 Tax=Sporolactobacillus terrae TaxID=269673 RepID=A0A410D8D8_9BACL|nr:translation initiation factor IF-2 [Sporolactobacillus terrae]QAA22381.1 translation initiation factor IF-2 [Sporolactobacillus terrae]QAA25357.1 translation initiation factor IF-2 [Sporolactobacillus terrae]UAK17166.1 translation initiation factor IF-2 [Sporolactobacillus terrae]BBN98697.1 translation initiation factor IF-2 [Sporolactobacillus terrae]
MSKMRVYEYAKEHHVSSKVIIAKLGELGIQVKSHMSIIADNAMSQLDRKMNGNAGASAQNITNKSKAEGKVNQTKTKEKKPNQTTSHVKNKQTNSRTNSNRSGESSNRRSSGRNQNSNNNNNNERNRFGGNGRNNNGGRRNFGRNRNNRRRGGAQTNRQNLEIKLPEKITLSGSLTVGQFAEKLGRPSTDIIKKLMALGVMATKNQDLERETIELLAADYGVAVEDEVVVDEASFEDEGLEIDEETAVVRPPVVTIMGHVDHGKTTLLDSIRHTKVTAGEAGGITQHIGAYQVTHDGKKITFLDTPGHAAFTTMRARGAEITDITVLVVAADDGVMPQTIEAIHHARAAKVPIIVAVNKIDKANANPDHVMQELSEQGLIPEDWGGDTIFVKLSAKKGTGIDELLEMILLVAEMEECKANPDKKARGAVIEAQLDKGKGPIATLLVQNGSLHIGDPIVVGNTYGRVRAMVNDVGRRVKKATPSTPVEITGLNNVPHAGDQFAAFDDEKKARQIGEVRAERALITERKQTTNKVSLDDLFEKIKEGDMKEINLVIKADVQGSVEALAGSLKKIDVDGVKVNIIHAGAGGISESDIILASASNAIIVGFNVRPDNHAQKVAEEENVDIRLYRVIYDAIDEIKAAMKGMLDPEYKEKVIGQLDVRTTFKVSKIGTIAGCYVTNGLISRDAGIRLVRDGVVIYEGNVDTLKRFKDDAKEVKAGFECGVTLENFNDIKEGDTMEAYVMEEVKPK